ncbi:MAG: 4-hydroxythreonine-4-phosphate dehydrogenase PdxA, partial [Candidatus Omnitrophota bacterium]|nr:4-hydroxythreonine-4-phosphate dehydrogenase PdxA [Candidatus Omnitrophota bacterium]
MPTSQSNKPVIAISMGDPSGIGPEIMLKALAEPSINGIANYIIAGDAKVLKKTLAILSRRGKLCLKKLSVNILDLHNVRISSFSFGKVSSNYGRASVEYIRRAYELVRTKTADAMVTAPINKFSVRKTHFKFSGHTEYLAHLSGAKKFAMMLAGGPLKIILVT